MYEDLKKNGPKNLYKLAKTKKLKVLDIDKMMFIKDGEGNIICSGEARGHGCHALHS